jgi:hypothetical protein
MCCLKALGEGAGGELDLTLINNSGAVLSHGVYEAMRCPRTVRKCQPINVFSNLIMVNIYHLKFTILTMFGWKVQ